MNSSKKIKKINQLKRKIVCLTAYSKPLAKILDKYCDIILVGDSLATAFYGMKSTKEINLDTMINHGISVSKSVKKSILVFDMPFNTYRNLKEAKLNIQKVLKKTKCDAVKLESNGKNFDLPLSNYTGLDRGKFHLVVHLCSILMTITLFRKA